MSEYSQDFEEEKVEQSQNESLHKMRLSIDVRSIKSQSFSGLVYVKYQSIQQLNVKQFKTHPAVQIQKPAEEEYENSFQSYQFVASKSNLTNMLSQESLKFECYHQDRLKKDILIGEANLNLKLVLKSPVRKTSQSYARVLDMYLPIDDVDQSQKSQIGQIHVLIYLEDLGPQELNLNQQQSYENQYQEMLNKQQTNQNKVLPQSTQEKGQLGEELNNLEYKIIWELENWKKSEETKFKFILKQKEIDYLNKLNEEWKNKEINKEKIFKRFEALAIQQEQKLKQKAAELQKRENKIVLLEEELKQKIAETARSLVAKDEELNVIKRKNKDEKFVSEKENAQLKAKIDELQNKIDKQLEEFQKYKKDQEKSPVQMIKNELSSKQQEIQDLIKEKQKVELTKEQYKEYCEKLRNEIIRIKDAYENLKDDLQNQNNQEIQNLKQQIKSLGNRDEKIRLQSFKDEFLELKKQQYGEEQQKSPQQIIKQGSSDQASDNSYQKYDWNNKNLSDYERLVQERDFLLNNGGYSMDDPLIQELNTQIQQLKV